MGLDVKWVKQKTRQMTKKGKEERKKKGEEFLPALADRINIQVIHLAFQHFEAKPSGRASHDVTNPMTPMLLTSSSVSLLLHLIWPASPKSPSGSW